MSSPPGSGVGSSGAGGGTGSGDGSDSSSRSTMQAMAIHAPRPTVPNLLAGQPAFSFAQQIQVPATPPLPFHTGSSSVPKAANTPPPSSSSSLGAAFTNTFTTPRGTFPLETPPASSSSLGSGSYHYHHIPTSPLSKQPTTSASSAATAAPAPFFNFGSAAPLSQLSALPATSSTSSSSYTTTSSATGTSPFKVPTSSFTFRFDNPTAGGPVNPLRDRLHKRRGHAPAPLRTKLAATATVPSPLSSANSDLHFNPYPHASPRGRLHSPAAPMFRDASASPSPAAMAAALAVAQAQAGNLPLQEALAARVPHEILLRIFGYLMPESGVVNPMFDDVPPSPPRRVKQARHKMGRGARRSGSPMSVASSASDGGGDTSTRVWASSSSSGSDDDMLFDDEDEDDDMDFGSGDAMDTDQASSDHMQGVESATLRPASAASNASSSSGSVLHGFNFLRNFVGSSSPSPASASSPSPSGSEARPKTAPSGGLASLPRRFINPFSRASLGRALSPAAATSAPAVPADPPASSTTGPPRPARIRPYYRNIHPCLRVCRSWYYAAIEYVHGEPVLENVLDFLAWLESLESTVNHMKTVPPPSLLAMPAESDSEDEEVDVDPMDTDAGPDEDGMDVDQASPDRAVTPTPHNMTGGDDMSSTTPRSAGKGMAASMEQLSFGTAVYPAISATVAHPSDKRQTGAFMVGSNDTLPSARTATKRSQDVAMGGSTLAGSSNLSSAASLEYLAQSAAEREQQHLAHLRGRPGFAGFAQTRTLRFERSNHIQTRYMSYRTLVKGSLPSPNQFIRDDHLNRIADAFQLLQPRVTTLDLRNCANVTDVAIIHLITAVSAKLRHLNVTNCRHIKDVTVRTIARVCDHLEELVLRGCGKVGDASIREVATYLGPQLKLLDVSGCMRINDPGLDYLAKFSGNYQLIQWEALRLEAAMRPISPAISSPLPPDTPTTPMAARAASPVHGRPQSPASPPASPRPGSPTQQYAQKGVVPRTDGRVGGKLRTLCVPGIRRQSRGGLVVFLTEMASIHPHVHTLEFSIPPPPSTSTKSMFSGGPALFWGLRGLTLTSLTIRDCEYLDDANLVPIAHYCKHLRSLTLFNAQHMTESAFGTLVSELRHLKVLVTRGAKTLRDSAIHHVIQAECAPHLIRLDLSDTPEFTDEAMYLLASVVVREGPVATPVPTTLTVMTPRMPGNVTPVLRSLQHLAMENCRRITFRGVMTVARILVPYDPKVPPPLSQTQGANGLTENPANAMPGAFNNNGPPGPPTSPPPTGPLPPTPTGAAGASSSPTPPLPGAAVPKDPLADQSSCLAYRTLVRARGRSLVSLHVSGAWEGVVTKATVAYRERHRDPQVTRDIHMANFAVRGLMRDEFDLGTVGSGGSPMLWSIMPATARPNAIWYCRFVRSALRNLLDEYSWIPVPVKVFSVIPAAAGTGTGLAASPPASP